MNPSNSRTLASRIASAALEKKATDILILDLRKLETLADFFVVCTGQVDQQVRAIVEHIESQVRVATGERVLHREGLETMNWVLLDYVDVVVHVFKPSFREFYRLEDLWGDADTFVVTEDSADSLIPLEPSPRKRAASKKTAAKKTSVKEASTKRAAAKKTAAKAPAKAARKAPAKSAAKKTAGKSATKVPAKRPRKSEA